MNKAKLNYWIDLVIAAGFVASLTSGLVFLLPPEVEAIGSDGLPRMLGLALLAWSDLHTISSLFMVAGIVAHVALHARWIRQMTKRVLTPTANPSRATKGVHCPQPENVSARNTPASVSRRRFLRLGWLALASAAGAGIALAASELFGQEQGTEADRVATPSDVNAALAQNTASTEPVAEPTPEDTSTPAPTPEATPTAAPTPTVEAGEAKVACPRGMVWDAYPGHCHLYVDRNGNGYCDYSEPIEG